jgi:hypothetical protein
VSCPLAAPLTNNRPKPKKIIRPGILSPYEAACCVPVVGTLVELVPFEVELVELVLLLPDKEFVVLPSTVHTLVYVPFQPITSMTNPMTIMKRAVQFMML